MKKRYRLKFHDRCAKTYLNRKNYKLFYSGQNGWICRLLKYDGLQHMSKKAPTFREEMNCQPKSLSIQAILNSVPTGSGEFTPDKPIKKSLRWNKTPGLEGHDGGTVDEAGTSNPSGMRGCQIIDCSRVGATRIHACGDR